jgi:hypothetical protein
MALITGTRDMELTKDLNMRQETGLKSFPAPLLVRNRLANSKAPTSARTALKDRMSYCLLKEARKGIQQEVEEILLEEIRETIIPFTVNSIKEVYYERGVL